MKIAIPTNDKENLFKRSGRTKGFLILNVDADSHLLDDYRLNTHSHDHDHKHGDGDDQGHSHKEIVDTLSDCDYLVVNMIGKHFGRDINEAGIKVYKTNESVIANAVDDFKRNVFAEK